MHCRRFLDAPISRRQMLAQSAGGFGAVALAALLAAEERSSAAPAPFAARPPHFPARARNVIFLFMEGGVSHVDTFDPKPLLDKENGQPFKMKAEPTQFNNNGNTLASPWKFRHYGQSGIPVSDLFPHVAKCVDSLSIIRSMTSGFSEHAAANYFLHTGTGQQGRPSMGSWAAYGLGSIGQDLPGFIVLNSGKMPIGGPDNFNSGFLPATYQGSIFRGGATAVANVAPLEPRPQLQLDKLKLMRRLDADAAARPGSAEDRQVESAIANYEMAFRMQSAVPEVMSLAGETEATRSLYGIGSANPMTRAYAESCLRARRLIELGVRFVELTVPVYPGDPNTWDAHGNLRKNHEANSLAVDQPIAGLLTDLKSRGLLDETLVVWASEFGRTPFAQGTDGRDHNPFGYTVWMAGGGAKPGNVYGATDEYGYKAVENRCEIYDLHATLLHLLGIDHKRLTYRYGGRDMRLTDVHGEVISGVLA
jgi:hypothetical protein